MARGLHPRVVARAALQACACAAACAAAAAQPVAEPPGPAADTAAARPQRVLITGHSPTTPSDDLPLVQRLVRSSLARQRAGAADSARLLQDIPGVSLYGAGGVSSLPAIHGLADDRLRVQVDGMDLAAACPNHMNPVLSYIDPSQVESVQVWAGIAPVSAGGDSIGGSIRLQSAAPRFAEGEGPLLQARAAVHAASNGTSRGASLRASWANDRFAVAADTAASRRANLRAARAFKPAAPGTEGGRVIPGDEIASTAYDTRNHGAELAWRAGSEGEGSSHLLQLKLGRQDIGFEGFVNQRMDMTANRSDQLNLRYTGRFGWGTLKAQAWRQDVDHAMDMGPDRHRYGTGMPMQSESTARGIGLTLEIPLGDEALLRLGAERQTQVLYDWWPAVGGAMGPNDFWNLDFGRRIRAGAFAEWQGRLAPGWDLLAGLRADRVRSDAGKVQGYDNGLAALWGEEAAAFNARDRRASHRHLDGALLLRHAPEAAAWSLDAGWARKTRSPGLYQRFPWSTQAMAALMNNTVGDGNGYIGNLALKPEVASTWAFSARWRDTAEAEVWRTELRLHRTEVRDFIDARRCSTGQRSAANATATQGFVLLQYANQRARLQGLDLNAEAVLARDAAWGDTRASLAAAWLRGTNTATGDGLYNIQPRHLKLTLQQQWGDWWAAAEWQAVAAKRRVSQVRNEIPTPGHALLHLRLGWQGAQWRVDAGIDNLFNRAYAPPLGGAYLGQGPSMTTAGIAWGVPVAGPGRSFSLALQWEMR